MRDEEEEEELSPLLPSNRATADYTKISRDSESAEDDKEKNGYGVWVAATFLVGELAGGGVLNLPHALSNTGWSGVGLIIASAGAIAFSTTRLALSWVLLEEQIPYYKTHSCRRPYQAIAEEAYGVGMRYVTEACLVLTLFGSSIVDLLFMAQILRALLWDVAPHVSVCSLIAVVALFLTPFTFLRSPKDFWATSIGAMGTTVFGVIVIVIEALREPPDYTPSYQPPTFPSFFLGLGAILFSFGGASTFPTIQNDMKDKSQFPRSIMIGFLCLTILYLPVSIICYEIYGSEVPSNILLSVSGVFVRITEALLLVHFLCAFLIIINPVMQSVDELFRITKDIGWHRFLPRIGVMLLALVIAETMPGFDRILDLIGGFSVTLMTFILPPIFYLKLSNKLNGQGLPYRNVSVKERVTLYCIVIAGIVGGCAVTISAVRGFAAPGVFDDSCILSEDFFYTDEELQ